MTETPQFKAFQKKCEEHFLEKWPDKGEHLHLIREKQPEPKPQYKFVKVFCRHCGRYIYVVHLELPPENPKKAK